MGVNLSEHRCRRRAAQYDNKCHIMRGIRERKRGISHARGSATGYSADTTGTALYYSTRAGTTTGSVRAHYLPRHGGIEHSGHPRLRGTWHWRRLDALRSLPDKIDRDRKSVV